MARQRHARSLQVCAPDGKRWIYVLRDPFTQEIRYVGATWNPVRNRLFGHISGRPTRSKSTWLDELKRRGARPLAEVIDCVDDNAWEASETWWINYLSDKGRLVNERQRTRV